MGAPVIRRVRTFGAIALAAFIGMLAATLPAEAQTVQYDLSTTSVLHIKLPVSQAVTVVVSDAVGKVVAADPTIADAQPITDRSIYVVGKAFGTTTVNLYSAAGAPVGLLAVEVGADTPAISAALKAGVPGSKIKVSTINGRIQLSGNVPDADSMQKALAIVGQFGSPAVINTLTMAGGQQVNLEVRILEASRNSGKELGINWSFRNPGGAFVTSANTSVAPAADAATFSAFIANVLAGPDFGLTAEINALESKGLVRTLADPNLTTLSGVPASFLAGGQVPIRTYDDNNHVTLNYKDFGVKLVFTPTVLDGGRIQIHLTPEVSDISSLTTGTNDPVFTTRNLDATVELRDGQSFSVAGLLQNQTKLSQDQLPWLGDVPIIGSLFKSSSFQKHDTELVVIVTPRLVQPSVPGQTVATPLDQTAPANDPEFFALSQMEVTSKMIQSFQSGSGVKGPYGYIIDLGN